MSTPTLIRASVGPKVLSRAPELFNQSIETTIAELIQNARRAGATQIDFVIAPEADGSVVTMCDNGQGIERPEILLTFGDSDWDAELDTRENAAGMGFFSLAPHGVTVWSRDWTAEFAPEAFRGEVEVPVEAAPSRKGTMLLFSVPQSPTYLHNIVRTCGHYAPIVVTLDGAAVEREDFLATAVFVTTGLGVRIGVVRTPGHSYYKSPNMNFYGHAIYDEKAARIREIAGSPTQCGREFVAYVDIVDAPELKLVLPARNEIIRNDAYQAIRTLGRHAIYTYLAQSADHYLSPHDVEAARAMGIAMPYPRAFPMSAWSYEDDEDGVSFAGGQPVVVNMADPEALRDLPIIKAGRGDDKNWLTAIGHALEDHDSEGQRFLDDAPNLTGFPAYDHALVASVAFTITVKSNAGDHLIVLDLDNYTYEEITAKRTAAGLPADGWAIVDDVAVVLTIPNHAPVRLQLAALVTTPDSTFATRADAFLCGTADIGDIAQQIQDATWSYSDEDDSDSKDLHYSEIVEHVQDLLMPAEEARMSQLLTMLRGEFHRFGSAVALQPSDMVEVRLSAQEPSGSNPKEYVRYQVTATFKSGKTLTETM